MNGWLCGPSWARTSDQKIMSLLVYPPYNGQKSYFLTYRSNITTFFEPQNFAP